MDKFNIFINQWGNTASILGLLITIIILSIRQIKSYKKSKKEQEKSFIDVQKHINSLATKATTLTQRQDLFMYANESLGRGRHLELRMRTRATTLYIFGIIVITLSIETYVLSSPNGWSAVVFWLLNITAILAFFSMNRIHNIVGKMNDSFSKGYLNATQQQVQKTIDVTENKE